VSGIPEGSPPRPWRPTREEVAAAEGRTVPDVIARGLGILFVGINPGLYSGAVGHHFARPGNRFWKALHGSGLIPRELSPFEESELLVHGLGITNLVERATAGAANLDASELRAGAPKLLRKLKRYQPAVVAFLGVTAYRTAFGLPRAAVGPQPEDIGRARVWVLPNPSGLNAHYQLPALIEAFAELRKAASSSAADR
jgi:TDG/mug DNA glycosylase family protein